MQPREVRTALLFRVTFTAMHLIVGGFSAWQASRITEQVVRGIAIHDNPILKFHR